MMKRFAFAAFFARRAAAWLLWLICFRLPVLYSSFSLLPPYLPFFSFSPFSSLCSSSPHAHKSLTLLLRFVLLLRPLLTLLRLLLMLPRLLLGLPLSFSWRRHVHFRSFFASSLPPALSPARTNRRSCSIESGKGTPPTRSPAAPEKLRFLLLPLLLECCCSSFLGVAAAKTSGTPFSFNRRCSSNRSITCDTTNTTTSSSTKDAKNSGLCCSSSSTNSSNRSNFSPALLTDSASSRHGVSPSVPACFSVFSTPSSFSLPFSCSYCPPPLQTCSTTVSPMWRRFAAARASGAAAVTRAVRCVPVRRAYVSEISDSKNSDNSSSSRSDSSPKSRRSNSSNISRRAFLRVNGSERWYAISPAGVSPAATATPRARHTQAAGVAAISRLATLSAATAAKIVPIQESMKKGQMLAGPVIGAQYRNLTAAIVVEAARKAIAAAAAGPQRAAAQDITAATAARRTAQTCNKQQGNGKNKHPTASLAPPAPPSAAAGAVSATAAAGPSSHDAAGTAAPERAAAPVSLDTPTLTVLPQARKHPPKAAATATPTANISATAHAKPAAKYRSRATAVTSAGKGTSAAAIPTKTKVAVAEDNPVPDTTTQEDWTQLEDQHEQRKRQQKPQQEQQKQQYDLQMMKEIQEENHRRFPRSVLEYRVGLGTDLHRLTAIPQEATGPLILGGVVVSYPPAAAAAAPASSAFSRLSRCGSALCRWIAVLLLPFQRQQQTTQTLPVPAAVKEEKKDHQQQLEKQEPGKAQQQRQPQEEHRCHLNAYHRQAQQELKKKQQQHRQAHVKQVGHDEEDLLQKAQVKEYQQQRRAPQQKDVDAGALSLRCPGVSSAARIKTETTAAQERDDNEDSYDKGSGKLLRQAIAGLVAAANAASHCYCCMHVVVRYIVLKSFSATVLQKLLSLCASPQTAAAAARQAAAILFPYPALPHSAASSSLLHAKTKDSVGHSKSPHALPSLVLTPAVASDAGTVAAVADVIAPTIAAATVSAAAVSAAGATGATDSGAAVAAALCDDGGGTSSSEAVRMHVVPAGDLFTGAHGFSSSSSSLLSPRVSLAAASPSDSHRGSCPAAVPAVGVIAHSDGDAVLHAISDALLGATAAGDIGQHFPDTDPAFRGVDSFVFLRHIAAKTRRDGWNIANVDVSLHLEAVKLGARRKLHMRENIVRALQLDEQFLRQERGMSPGQQRLSVEQQEQQNDAESQRELQEEDQQQQTPTQQQQTPTQQQQAQTQQHEQEEEKKEERKHKYQYSAAKDVHRKYGTAMAAREKEQKETQAEGRRQSKKSGAPESENETQKRETGEEIARKGAFLTAMERVNIKAKTGERLGVVGRCEAVECFAVVTLCKDTPITELS